MLADRDTAKTKKPAADEDDDAPRKQQRVAMNADADEDGAADYSGSPAPDMPSTFRGASREERAPETIDTTGSVSHAHGCAGCAMTGGNGASSALLILGTLLMLRRRRRHA